MMNSPLYCHFRCWDRPPARWLRREPVKREREKPLAIWLAAENTTQNIPSDRARAKRFLHRTIVLVTIVTDHPLNDISNERKDVY